MKITERSNRGALIEGVAISIFPRSHFASSELWSAMCAMLAIPLSRRKNKSARKRHDFGKDDGSPGEGLQERLPHHHEDRHVHRRWKSLA
ncbi:MAG: hypothetical protein MI723_17995 [Caulobacterales bacterium]|nr:hypothetical protein [Caulobacterales bacterium]